MKLSKYFLKTSKSVADDDRIVSAKLLKQAAFIKESVAGRYYILPIGHRVQQKIMEVIKQELDREGAQEMITPILHPLELWQETNRADTASFELMKVKDRRDAEFALGGTAEEMFVDLVRQFDLSYRDLPFCLYQFSVKFRDELRARGGLLRVREFIMKDAYSFHTDEQDFQSQYAKMKELYQRVFEKLGLKTIAVEADSGYIGGEYCHELIMESDIGESNYFVTEDGDYAAHEDVAVFKKEIKKELEAPKPLESVEAPRGATMQDGADFHSLPLWQQIKDVLYVNEKGHFILAIIRGDLDVNEIKLKKLTESITLRHATDEEIRSKLRSEPGFISPVGIKENLDTNIKLSIISDDSLRTIANAYGGSNKKNTDLININIDRDFQPDVEGDIASAKDGYLTESGAKLVGKRGIEIGHIFQLGHHYSKKMKGAVFSDKDGIDKPLYMGCYGIGIGRTMAAIVESHHDQKGIIWPDSCAPFQVHLISLDGAQSEAEALYKELDDKGIEVLFDDRQKTAGEKFADADLIGIPYRIIVSPKTIAQASCELKKRDSQESSLIALDSIIDKLI